MKKILKRLENLFFTNEVETPKPTWTSWESNAERYDQGIARLASMSGRD